MASKKIKDLKPDPRNANKHSEFGTGLLENSIRDLGLGRSVLISRDDVLIAGNGVHEAAGAIGLEKVKIVETDGKELIAVKRMDIQSGTPEFYKMALADNIVAQKNIVLDTEIVEGIVQDFPATKTWGSIVLPEDNDNLDHDRANGVEMKFQLSNKQYSEVKKAMKLGKQLFKDQFQVNENTNEQGNVLYFIVKEFLKNHK